MALQNYVTIHARLVYADLLVDRQLLEPRHEKTNILYICKNKDADQLRGNGEADQRLCFHYIVSTIPLLPKSEFSSF